MPTYYDQYVSTPTKRTALDAVLEQEKQQEAAANTPAKTPAKTPDTSVLPMSGITVQEPKATVPTQIDETKSQQIIDAAGKANTPSGVLDGLIRPLSAQEQANRERAYAARQGVVGLGNGLAALANVLYTGAGATPQQIPDIPDADGKQLLSWQDRLMQDRYRQANMDIAAQREAADEAYRQLQLELAKQKAADDKARDERDFNYQVEQDARNLKFKEAQAALEQQNAVQKMSETMRHNKANEETAHTRAARTGSGSGSGGSGTAWHPLKGYGGSTVDVNATMVSNKTGYTAISNRIPEAFKEEWGMAKDNMGRRSQAEILQDAMQKNEQFQQWMIDHGYARPSAVQDAPQDNGVLDLGDDSDDDVFDGANF
jgi:hypothetical protein